VSPPTVHNRGRFPPAPPFTTFWRKHATDTARLTFARKVDSITLTKYRACGTLVSNRGHSDTQTQAGRGLLVYHCS
jgi:hypothetical protein